MEEDLFSLTIIPALRRGDDKGQGISSVIVGEVIDRKCEEP